MHLDAVEAGALGVLGRLAEARHDARQLVVAQRVRHLVGLLALRRVRLVVGDPQGTGRHGLRAVVQQRVTSPATMPDLAKNLPARGVDAVGHLLPTGDLRVRVDARLPPAKGRVACHDHRRLGQNQTSAGPLRVVIDHQVGRHMIGIRPATRERGHDDAVGEFECAESDRRE